MAYGRFSIANLYSPPTPAEALARLSENQSIFDVKKDALQQASAIATLENRKPTLDDYLATAMTLSAQRGMEFTPEMAADLSGQTLDGFLIKEAKNHPTPAFYDNLNFKDAILTNSLVDPAASFNTQLKHAGEIFATIFKGHSDGQFELGHGKYNDITLEQFNGGTIILDHSQIDGLTMQGQKIAQLWMANGSSISNLCADGTSIVKIIADADTSIQHASFKDATISMAGTMKGMTLQDVDFTGTNLCNVDLSGAKLTKVTLPAKGMHGLNLSGATLNDITLDNGKAITSPEQLTALGATFEKPSTIAFREPVAQIEHPVAKVEAARQTMNPLAQLLGNKGIDLSGISGGEQASLATVTPGKAVSEIAYEKPAPAQNEGMSMNQLLAMHAAPKGEKA